ncbi:translation initiation factor [Myxococcus sp. MISCRS1]|uniref:translation initiation factor n=1 Tax=Myxococcus sp. MISCRS1 TaxID=2996786 RepID=UPI00226F0AAB|nr:translation initiation factor [Myxococcus sp. MISCRS1]MCY1000991.1 translation initiation factor [Myxococcus sp. MISCRS1]
MGKRDKKAAPAAPPAPFHNPFAALAAKREELPVGTVAPVAAPPSKSEPKGPARAVVRMERKGRGGKEVTVVEHLELPAPQREVWLKALKNSLGCGGVVEDDTLVLQGDQRERLPALLEARGVRKVTVG